MAEEGKKISFGFTKSIKKTALQNVIPQEKKKVDYVECVDEKAIKVIGEEAKKNEPLVIPMLGSKTWHDRIINKIDADIYEPKTKSNDNGITSDVTTIKQEPVDEISNKNVLADCTIVPSVEISEVKIEVETESKKSGQTLEEQAVREIIEDLKSAEIKVGDAKAVVLPIADNQSLNDTEESTLEDYEHIPIDAFGVAMLRGMGWEPGKGIGKNEKVVTAVIPELRPKGMGLGADKVTMQKNSEQAKSADNEQLELVKGAFVKIIAGKQCNNYGQIEGFDDDAGRLIIKMALGGSIVTVNEFMIRIVTKAEYSKNSKILNTTKYEEYKDKDTSNEKGLTPIDILDSEESGGDDEKRRIRGDLTDDTSSKKKLKRHRKYSSDKDSDSDRKSRSRKDSDSDEASHRSKKLKKSKKHKSQDSSAERSSRKSRKKDKEREKKRDRKLGYSKSLDKRKHKKHKKSRSRSPKKR